MATGRTGGVDHGTAAAYSHVVSLGYQWLHKPVSAREYDNARLLGKIRDSYAASRGVYGARRVFADLREAGETCGKHRVARLMCAHKIKALRGYKAPRRR